MQNITRTIIGRLCLSVVAITGIPTSSLACWIKTCSPSTTATPFREVLNEDQFDDTEGQVNSEPTRKRGTFTDDVLMFIECRPDMMGGGNSRALSGGLWGSDSGREDLGQ